MIFCETELMLPKGIMLPVNWLPVEGLKIMPAWRGTVWPASFCTLMGFVKSPPHAACVPLAGLVQRLGPNSAEKSPARNAGVGTVDDKAPMPVLAKV